MATTHGTDHHTPLQTLQGWVRGLFLAGLCAVVLVAAVFLVWLAVGR